MSVISNDRRAQPPPVRPLPAALRWFHWGTVCLLALLFGLAWTFDWLGPSPSGATLVEVHRSFGILLFAVVCARLIWRATHRIDPLPRQSPLWERLLASGVQASLYLALLAMPAIGWLGSALSGDVVRFFGLPLPDLVGMDEDMSDRLFDLHETLGWTILALVALHVLGALRHQFVKRDGLLTRMRPW
ncbi:cytochrome b [Aureimonas psammosilenae]|uniref:cytochrome b n=1 Tax=Aureimonas psammosilenae TaxID=2495496 RepID=UPI001869E807|nr:cytochrome b [Aureimonas psammosilenae]